MAPLLLSKAEHTTCGRFKKSIFKSYFKIHYSIYPAPPAAYIQPVRPVSPINQAFALLAFLLSVANMYMVPRKKIHDVSRNEQNNINP